MQKIQKIGVASAAKMLFFILFCFGLINTLVLISFTLLGIGLPGRSPVPLLLVVIFPFLYALIGLITGAVVAFFYNLLAPRIGGIEVELR